MKFPRRIDLPLIVLCLALAAGCGSRPGPRWELFPGGGEDCFLFPSRDGTTGEIRVALSEPVGPQHAPVPQNDSERLVFRHLYETLVQVDCEGRVFPGLACSWERSEDGRVWSFTLRDGARTVNGRPVLAGDIARSWTENRSLPVGPGDLAPWSWIDPDSIHVLDEKSLRVALAGAIGTEPSFFAQPSLAVADRAGSSWPFGTGPYRVESFQPAGESRLVLTANLHAPRGEPNRPRLEFRIDPGADPRDLLVPGVDLLFVRDPSSLDYAASLPDFRTTAIPWDCTYYLLSPVLATEDPPADRNAVGARGLSDRFREELARDAISPGARPAGSARTEDPFSLRRCGVLSRFGAGGEGSQGRPPTSSAGNRRIVYPAGDAEARRLAERIVALAMAVRPLRDGAEGDEAVLDTLFPDDGRGEPVAVGLGEEEFALSLASGSERAYILVVRRSILDRCLENRTIPASSSATAAETLPSWNPAIPLVQTCAHLVSRRGLGRLRLTWDGTFLLDEARRSAASE